QGCVSLGGVCVMSWGYWGIDMGLVGLVAMLFVCLQLVYSNSKTSPDASPSLRDRSGEQSQKQPVAVDWPHRELRQVGTIQS
ncbi:MAG TPA: hypothetical protein VI359_00170, partial [Nitrospiraceae bacterium]